jgi:hypothetical protein
MGMKRMFNSWMFYLILGLSASTLTLGWLSLSLHDDKLIAEQALVQAINVNSDMQKSLNLRDLSCKIDDTSVVEVEAIKKDLQTKIEVVSDNIEKLRKPVAVKQENIKNENLKPNVLPDDGLLSPNIVSLLKQGYCTTYPTDSECISK